MVKKKAKILHLGNIVNYGYRLVKHLRENSVDAHLLMNPKSPKLSHPSNITKRIPSWVHFWKSASLIGACFEILSTAKKYDLVHSYYTTVLPLQFSSTPYIFHAMGSDLRENAQWPIRGIFMRRALRKACFCICSQADLLDWYAKIDVEVRISYPPIDTDFYSPKNYPKNKRLEIFHPPQQDWIHKANDEFFRAFARLVKEDGVNAHCTCISSGSHLEQTKELLAELGITEHVTWLPLLSPEQIREQYHKSDIIADEYVVGSFGLITLESLACGKTVISYYNKRLTKEYYPEEPPVLWAHKEQDIYEQLQVAKDAAFRKKLGKTARAWAVKHHSPDRVAKNLLALYEELLPEKRLT